MQADKMRGLLFITITRHGPKQGFDGRLSAQGRDAVKNFYNSIFSSAIAMPAPDIVVSSPIPRAVETAEIYHEAVIEKFPLSDLPLVQDERLSEKDTVEFVKELPLGHQADWFRYWYQSEVGKFAVSDFAKWILQQINQHSDDLAEFRIAAFSHGPVMAAFILRLEDILDTTIMLPTREGQDRLDFEKLFGAENGDFDFLSTLKIEFLTQWPETTIVSFGDTSIRVPLTTLVQL